MAPKIILQFSRSGFSIRAKHNKVCNPRFALFTAILVVSYPASTHPSSLSRSSGPFRSHHSPDATNKESGARSLTHEIRAAISPAQTFSSRFRRPFGASFLTQRSVVLLPFRNPITPSPIATSAVDIFGRGLYDSFTTTYEESITSNHQSFI